MLRVEEALRAGETSLRALKDERAIDVVEHPGGDPIVICNYSQIESPKRDEWGRQCRGLTLEKDTYRVVARSFDRFFNLGEHPDEDASFDWSSFAAQEKCDGSLLLIYKYDGAVRVNTRGSFAKGAVYQQGKQSSLTWEELAWATSIRRDALDALLTEGQTFVCELCSPWNKVVRSYHYPQLFLLTAFVNETRYEFPAGDCEELARELRIGRPQSYEVSGPDDIYALLAREKDPTFEGFVVRDRFGHRLKVKNPKYVALHHLRGNGDNIFSPKYLIPFILGTPEEEEELLTYYAEVRQSYQKLKGEINMSKEQMLSLWEEHKSAPTQKEFALGILSANPPGSIRAVLFEARKSGRNPLCVWQERAGELLLREYS